MDHIDDLLLSGVYFCQISLVGSKSIAIMLMGYLAIIRHFWQMYQLKCHRAGRVASKSQQLQSPNSLVNTVSQAQNKKTTIYLATERKLSNNV